MARKENYDKFMLLLWKNYLLQLRQPGQTVIELISPMVLVIVLIVVRSTINSVEHETIFFNAYCVIPSSFCGEAQEENDGLTLDKKIAFAPTKEEYNTTMQNMGYIVNKNILGFSDSEALKDHFFSSASESTVCGVEFDENERDKTMKISVGFRSELQYDIGFELNNWKTYMLYPYFRANGPRAHNVKTGGPPDYFKEGFLTIQAATAYAFILQKKGIVLTDHADAENKMKELPLIKMARNPYYSWVQDVFLEKIDMVLEIILMFSFVYPAINLTKAVCIEKELQLKEAMKIMGLPGWIHWAAWFVKSFTFIYLSATFVILLLSLPLPFMDVNAIFSHSTKLILFLFFLCYVLAVISFSFLISTFFAKSNTAAAFTGLCWFVTFFPYTMFMQDIESASTFTLYTTSIFLNTALSYGISKIIALETSGEGANFSNLFKGGESKLILGVFMIMLLIDSFLMFLLALYIEQIMPGDYGVPKPWNFLFQKEYWHPPNHHDHKVNYINLEQVMDADVYEKEPNLPIGIQIIDLYKAFKKHTAVRHLYLNMFEGQITALLGHNGAGKTTTMSMLTGIIPPTSGTIIVRGYDIVTELNEVRKNIGLCPQHNILFNELTVKEHLYFYSKLKGLPDDEIEVEITRYIKMLDLEPKTNKKSCTLSGGMKRRLNVGIAMIGGTKVVILDEPSAGVDPASRRVLWEFLMKEKQGRTILISSHFMDEADVLGDRIAVMSAGKLLCCGTSYFLKKRYGCGYQLIIEKTPTCDPNRVTAKLAKVISDVEINKNVGSELTYNLPEQKQRRFKHAFKKLEKHAGDLGISGYGISLTTMEEVFLRCGAEEVRFDGSLASEPASMDYSTRKFIVEVKRVEGWKFITGQIYAIHLKKYYSFLRSWPIYLTQMIIPMIFICLGFFVLRHLRVTNDLPERVFTLADYDTPVTIVSKTSNDYKKIYVDNVKKLSDIVEKENINQTLVDYSKDIPLTLSRHYIISASFKENVLFGWFNNDPYHSAPLSLAMLLNAIYKKELNTPNQELIFSNDPMGFSPLYKIYLIARGRSMGFVLGLNLSFAVAFAYPLYTIFYIKERTCKAKHLQYISGVKIIILWSIAFIWDFIYHIIIVIALIFTLLVFDEDGYNSADDLARFAYIMIMFGYGCIPLMYIMSFWFDEYSSGYTKAALILIFLGPASYVIIHFMGLEDFHQEAVSKPLHNCFLISPAFAMATAVRDLYKLSMIVVQCKKLIEICMKTKRLTEAFCTDFVNHDKSNKLDCENSGDYYNWDDGIGKNITAFWVSGTICIVILLILEFQVIRRIKDYFHRAQADPPERLNDIDPDVEKEIEYVHNTRLSELQRNNIIIMKDVTKRWGNFLAVNGVCLTVKRFECFGLLGVNGAGKTTTFEMLTGDITMSYGDAWIRNYSITHELKHAQSLMGYCPQFDALLDSLTCRETLKIFALLRGVPPESIPKISVQLAKDFDFFKHIEKKVKQLSGGNKRKLSTAIAVIGNPSVVFLDEPTTGMDPATRRFLWNALCQVRDSGKSIIFTTHSMEECEALCTRLAIMVNGNFKCLGSVQHLKNTFAEGYSLIMKLRRDIEFEPALNIVNAYVFSRFRGAVLKEKHQELINYFIPKQDRPLSKMFGSLERFKQKFGFLIEDYTLSQSSLEQIFLSFVKYQREETA